LKPRTAPPQVRVEFCRFANADNFIRLEDGRLHVRMSDLLAGAPAPVIEALAWILLGKLYRKEVPRLYTHRYKLYLNRRDVRRQAHLIRQVRGRKFISGPEGKHRHLEDVFERLNRQHFDGMMGRPQLGWSRGASRSLLGHFDPSHNAIIISRIFDRPEVPELALEYVMFHEMLHLRYPVDHAGARRRVHTKEFREAEKQFPRLKEAKELLKKL
jgi:predicted metal-dependent hydrolase